jgi:hypothetical protein
VILSTGPIENNSVNGLRPTNEVIIVIVNNHALESSEVLIQGYVLNGTRNLYVNEFITVNPNQVITKNYTADFSSFEFLFTTGGAAEAQTEISFWGKDTAGQLVDVHHLVSEELLD